MTQIVNGLHFCCFQCDFTCFISALYRLIDLNFNNLSLNDFSFLSYSDTYKSKKQLDSLTFITYKVFRCCINILRNLPIDFLKACVSASVLDISSENISDPANIVNGVSSPRLFAIPIAMAVLPVPGCPPIRIARPAIF